MSVTVKQLNNDQFEELLNRNIKEQLEIIDTKILRTTKKLGYNEITSMLPYTFNNIPYDKPIVTNIIYSKILKSLEGRGFSVQLQIQRYKPTNIVIGWNNTTYTSSDIHKVNEYIREKMV